MRSPRFALLLLSVVDHVKTPGWGLNYAGGRTRGEGGLPDGGERRGTLEQLCSIECDEVGTVAGGFSG